MTSPYIIHDLIWDYCITMPHCCSVGSRFHIESDKDIKSTSAAIFFSLLLSTRTEAEKWSGTLAINVQTVVIPGRARGAMISPETNTESPCDWSSEDESCCWNICSVDAVGGSKYWRRSSPPGHKGSPAETQPLCVLCEMRRWPTGQCCGILSNRRWISFHWKPQWKIESHIWSLLLNWRFIRSPRVSKGNKNRSSQLVNYQ